MCVSSIATDYVMSDELILNIDNKKYNQRKYSVLMCVNADCKTCIKKPTRVGLITLLSNEVVIITLNLFY